MTARTAALALAVRVLVAVLTRSFFQPDEYFQSLEVAHHLVFGYGALTWEWVSARPIRSIVYPALNVPVYWALKVLRLDDTELLIVAPKVLHGCLAAGTDIYVRRLARNVLGERYVSTAFFLSLTSLFHILALSRSLSNSLETTLTTAALSYYPWDLAPAPTRSQLRKLLAFAALACAVRITSAITWAVLLPPLLWRLRARPPLLRAFALDAILTATTALLIIFTLDSLYYHTPTLTPLSFLLTNASPLAAFYGTAPPHYYLSQALPVLAGPALPFVLHGAWRAARGAAGPRARALLGTVAALAAAYSLAPHKEWRFLHPALPLLHVLAAPSLADLPSSTSTRIARIARIARISPRRAAHAFLLALALVGGTYAARAHAHAQGGALRFLRREPAAALASAGFLMPCHSAPAHAQLHRRAAELWALGCEPPVGLAAEARRAYRDQTDVFYAAPLTYLLTRFPPAVDPHFPASPHPSTPPGTPAARAAAGGWAHAWPSHLVFFGALLEHAGVERVLRARGYGEVWRAGGALEEDARRRGGVRVWRYRGAPGAGAGEGTPGLSR